MNLEQPLTSYLLIINMSFEEIFNYCLCYRGVDDVRQQHPSTTTSFSSTITSISVSRRCWKLFLVRFISFKCFLKYFITSFGTIMMTNWLKCAIVIIWYCFWIGNNCFLSFKWFFTVINMNNRKQNKYFRRLKIALSKRGWVGKLLSQ